MPPATPEGGETAVAQGVSPVDHAQFNPEPHRGDTIILGNSPVSPLRGLPYFMSLIPGLTPWATTVSPPSGVLPLGRDLLAIRV